MRGVSVLILIGTFVLGGNGAQFLNHRPFPTYSLENMPDTAFSCRDKILGGYYADVDAECQMFHVCVKVAGVGVQDFRFLCPNGTAFDQDHQICAEWEDVDCDATTLYYSSDNFDLYRIGSGFEAKAKKYGEDEETFALQRAETGDVRINKEHQAQRVNQQKDNAYFKKSRNQDDRDIFRGSSSSNFFNNKNNGKENDDDYDDNVNINQDNDTAQKRKLNRKPLRTTTQATTTTTATQKRIKQTQTSSNQDYQRNQRPTGFINNFAGSSYVPTTTTKTTTSLSNERYTVAVNNHRLRNSQRHRVGLPDRYNDADNFRVSQTTKEPLTVSTPAPFRTQQQQIRQTTTTQNYPKSNKYDDFELKKTPKQTDVKKTTSNDNYPTTFSPKFQKQYYTTKKFENYPTTFSPKTDQAYKAITYVTTQYTKQNQQSNTQTNQQQKQYNPQQYNTQTNQQQKQYNTQQNQQFNTQQNQQFNSQRNTPQPFSQKPQQFNEQSTQKTTPFTQYTPTVTKTTSTVASVARSNRYDETHYDDGSYDPKYDYDTGRDDEFLKTAHSQNIAKSRNDLQNKEQKQTSKAYYESPRPFSVTQNVGKQQEYTKTTQNITPKYTQQQNQEQKYTQKQQQQQKITTTQKPKKTKDVSYDYAYYDTNGSEPEYDIDTEIKKSTVKN